MTSAVFAGVEDAGDNDHVQIDAVLNHVAAGAEGDVKLASTVSDNRIAVRHDFQGCDAFLDRNYATSGRRFAMLANEFR